MAVLVRTFFLGISESLKVLYRINDEKVVQATWLPASGGQGAFVSPPASALALLKSLPDNGKLFVRVFDFSGNGHDAQFNLGTVSVARAQVAAACGWQEKQPASRAAPIPGKRTDLSQSERGGPSGAKWMAAPAPGEVARLAAVLQSMALLSPSKVQVGVDAFLAGKHTSVGASGRRGPLLVVSRLSASAFFA
jgi:hypothetical protein